MGRQLFLFIILSIHFYGCSLSTPDKAKHSVNIALNSDGEILFSDIFTDFHLIHPKLSDSTIIGEIEKLQVTDSFIYVLSDHKLYAFNRKGILSYRLDKKGNGPGEYLGIFDFEVADTNIYILSRGDKKIIRFDLRGENPLEMELGQYALKMKIMKGDTILVYNGEEYNGLNKFRLNSFSSGKLIAQNLPIDPYKSRYLHLHSPSNFSCNGRELFLFEPFNDVIYLISQEKVEPIYRIGFDGKNLPEKFFRVRLNNIGEFFQLYKNTNYAYGIFDLLASQGWLFFSFYLSGEKVFALINRETHTGKASGILQDNVNFSGIDYLTDELSFYSQGGKVAYTLPAAWILQNKSQILNSGLLAITEGLIENDNPIIVVASLK